jgi:uncharacterized membrane protein
MLEKVRTGLRWLLALLMVGVGVMHFARPEPFLLIMPPYLPWHLALVYLSGVAEVVLGAALLVSRTRSAAGWGLIALYVAVFPANLYQATSQVSFSEEPISPLVLWGRLPLQLVFMVWAYAVSRPDRGQPSR